MRKIIIIAILLGLFFVLSCSDDKPTEPVDYVDIAGIVFVKQNGYTGNISGAQVQIGEYSTVTDSIGQYHLTVPKGTYDITAQHPLYGSRTYEAVDFTISKYFTLSLLSDLFDVSGSIVGLENEPLAGVVVSLQSHLDTTDSEGEYLFEDVPQGLWILKCAHLDYDPVYDTVNVVHENSLHNLNLTRIRVAVSGHITNESNQPVANAEVKFDDTLSVYSDSNGDYVFPSVGPGVHYISCDYLEYNYFEASITIIEDDITTDITLNKNGYSVYGTLSHAIDGPLEGIEVSIDDSYFDTTDIKGHYQLEGLTPGDYQLQLNTDTYSSSASLSFTLLKSNLNKDLILKRLVVDTLWISKDASVQYSTDYASVADHAYGEGEYLTLMADNIDVFSHSDLTHTYFYHKSRFYVILPYYDATNADSVLLSFTRRDNAGTTEVFISRAASPWVESEITWNNQPTLFSDYKIMDISLNNYNEWVINISDDESFYKNANGLSIVSVAEGYMFVQFYLDLYSSETVDSSKRPKVLVYRSI